MAVLELFLRRVCRGLAGWLQPNNRSSVSSRSLFPFCLVLYFTFKTSMERVEDANKHVEQLNSLYLSTIETLAMAIDAKDQVTHGHIRRVQTHATGWQKKLAFETKG